MIKVVYFDENSATDYLNIYNGGEEIQQKEKIKENTKALAEKFGLNFFAKFNWLALGSKAEGNVEADFTQSGQSFLKTTLSNTVLTDFLHKADKDERIEEISKCTLTPPRNSIAFFKMFTPYLVMTNAKIDIDDGFSIDVSKLDEAFKNGKGYYEMLAQNTVKRCILRFNISSFRNNYGIADLTKMDLTYYAVEVGKTEESNLDIGKEFSMEQHSISSAFEVIDGEVTSRLLEVYDVILAGVNVCKK